MRLDLLKMLKFVLKFCWVMILCGAIGFGVMYYRASKRPDVYTASGTMYIINANSSLYNYSYLSTSDVTAAVQLINTYSVLIRSDRVMSKVLDYPVEVVDEYGEATGEMITLREKYPGLTASGIASTISMYAVQDTPNVGLSCTTRNAQMSLDFCNAVLQIAPDALRELTGAGDAKLVDSPKLPMAPNARHERSEGIRGGVIGMAAALAVLALIYLFNQRITDPKELTDSYVPPVLATIKRDRHENEDPGAFLLNGNSEMEVTENYAKLRVNLLYTLAEKQNHVVEITSAISGEGKSTIAANLGIICAMAGKRVILVDIDMRRACQRDVFHYGPERPGLSDILIGDASWRDTVMNTTYENLDILPAGKLPPNPAELLESKTMSKFLDRLSRTYDLVLLDAPPINIVSDPLALSKDVAGCIFVVRQGLSTHREIRKALTSAEMTGLGLLGFVFYGEKIHQGSLSSRKHYKKYYHRYDNRDQIATVPHTRTAAAPQKRVETKSSGGAKNDKKK
ncbi:MAG: polysaccharide biosynthesis tyrosine autokinase [Clostridia bacterium]|nr:polysaccharide biosynthesis tyrosine autokinase [Clostridia bacterium]